MDLDILFIHTNTKVVEECSSSVTYYNTRRIEWSFCSICGMTQTLCLNWDVACLLAMDG
jgi:hypothetical protein